MPWSLRKFLSPKDQQSPEGGDKGREKKEKSSKSGKSGKKRPADGKNNTETANSEAVSFEPLRKETKTAETSSRECLESKKVDVSLDQVSDDVSFGETIKSDDDYKSVEDFPADCENLAGYLETAILESACNTLERNPHKVAPAELTQSENMDAVVRNSEVEPPQGVSPEEKPVSSSFDAGLYVEYVNYDLLGADLASGSSGEYYSSDEEGDSKVLNSNNNSNVGFGGAEKREAIMRDEDVVLHGPGVKELGISSENGSGSNNNLSPYYDRAESVKNNKANDEEKGKLLNETERNVISSEIDDVNTGENQTATIDLGRNQGEDTDRKNNGNLDVNNKTTNIEDKICPVHDENVDLTGDNQDMEKARSIFGMCLCQNGEQVDHVADLDFRNCNLKQVPHEIFQYAQTLTHLQLDSNTLSDLPKSLFSCENLEYLTVSDNDLGSLPPTLAGLANLKYLDISKNVIEDVPDCIRCCKSLNVLDASVNPIERLSEGFTQLVGLSELYLNDCFLEFLPANFGRLVQLTVLELRDNQLQILPKSIRRLTLLKRLDLGGNIFQEWPDVVCELRRLTELWLDGNELSRVPEEIGELTSLVYLDLSRNFIEAVPSRIGSLTELTDLLLCENHITELPDTLGFLDKLTMLKASMNQLVLVPETIGKLREVEELDLSHNKLSEVPETIGNLTDMHTLLLDNNILRSIPPELGRCGNLNVLQLSRNMLDEIPREIGDLSQLRVFNICRNRLSHLPITIIKLAQLEALWVSSNQSKPNVPLHAELGPDGKTRILTNILFPQTEQDPSKIRDKTDADGYANDAADDDEPPLFRKQRGVTRVAFNLAPICHEDEDDYTDEEDDDMEVDVPLIKKDQNSNNKLPHNDHYAHSVDVSEAVISNNGLHIQPSSLLVRSPVRSDDVPIVNDNDTTFGTAPNPIPLLAVDTSCESSHVGPFNGSDDWGDPPPAYNELTMPSAPETSSVTSQVTSTITMESSLPDLVVNDTEKSKSVPDLRKNQNSGESVDAADTSKSAVDIAPDCDPGEDDPTQTPKIKTWSSHSHLPSIPNSEPMDIVAPVAAEIISNRSSISSSPSISPEESQKPDLPAKTSRLPIPSRALYEQSNKKSPEKDKMKETFKYELSAPQKRDALNDIPYVDSDLSEEGDSGPKTALASKPKKAKPPPPPRKDSLLSKNSPSAPPKPPLPPSKPNLSTGLKVFTPALLQKQKLGDDIDPHDTPLALPPHNSIPPPEASSDGLPSTDRDSGVGNDADSQESIPECPDEDILPPPPDVAMETHHTRPVTAPKPTIKSVANFQVSDVRSNISPPGSKSPPAYAPVILPSNSSQPPPIAPKPSHIPNKITANIKMFESISLNPETKQPQLNSKSLADLLPTGPRKTEEKAIIPPNNHLNGSVNKNPPQEFSIKAPEVTSIKDIPMSPIKSPHSEFSDVITEQQQQQSVMFLHHDDDVMNDGSAFSKALAEITSSPEKKKLSRTNSKGDASESSKQNQFRERLEKIMQQQKSVSAATKAAQNGTALSLSRKTSFNNTQSQPTSPDGSGLEKLTAESSFPVPDYPASPVSPDYKPKKQSVSDRMKNKLDRGAPGIVKSASSSRISRSRPGSAPAAQLLQRRNSNQRNSIAAPENGAEEKRTLAPLYGSDERAGMDGRSRSKSIEQQLGQLFLDSDEERLNHDERMSYERRHDDVIRREQHRLKKDSSGIRGSRNSLCSPPPVRHNMYAKARSSTNTASTPMADWKHKLLQHIERKRLEKQQISAIQSVGRPTTQQPQRSIGRIKSPPRTSAPAPKQPQYYNNHSNYAPIPQPQARREQSHRPMGKSVTTSALNPQNKTVTNTHQYNPDGQGVRSHFAGNSRAAKLAKQRTFTPGPESHGNSQMMAPRPKSAMEKFVPQVDPAYAEPPSYAQAPQPTLYADLRTYKPPPLPTYEDHLHRRVVPYQPESQRLGRSESTRKSFRGNNHGRGNYEDLAGYPLRQSGSHESLMDAARYTQHDAYFPNTPLRNASSHDSVLDQPPYQPASYAPAYYSPPQQQRYPPNHIPQRYPVSAPENPKRSKYNSPDYATYVNVYEYDRSPVEYHNRPQMQDPYRLGYRGSVRADPRQQQQQQRGDQGNYSNYAYPPNNFHNPRQPPSYERYRQRESLSPTAYRPLAEREDGSVASAFRPYHQVQQQPSHKSRHHNPYMQTYGLPPNQVMSPTEYKNQGRHMSPPSNYQYLPEQSRHLPRPPPGWSDPQEDFERVTVSVRRNPTFGFHVMGGVGAGGNPYRPVDEGVFVTHVSPGGAADNKLQAGDKILLVNGSDFVGISHKRAVDLLRNAGQVAVLVVERSLGKPV